MPDVPSSTFFRDARVPTREDDRRTHERFLLDTYADRRAEASESPVTAFARRLRKLVSGDLR